MGNQTPKFLKTNPNDEQQDIIKDGILSHYIKWSYFANWLKRKAIILGDYAKWEDKSDVAILNAYVEKNGGIPIRVLCLLNRAGDFRDSYYHWKVYAKDDDGIRIDFNKDKLLKSLRNKVIARKVKYPNNRTLEKVCKSTALPFVKRASYDSDKEFRLVFSGSKDTMKSGEPFEFGVGEDFFRECVDSVRLACSMPNDIFRERKDMLKEYGIKKVYRSKIFRYEQWEKMVLKFADFKHSSRHI